MLESRYLTTVSSLPRQVATFLGRLDTVVKYLDSNIVSVDLVQRQPLAWHTRHAIRPD